MHHHTGASQRMNPFHFGSILVLPSPGENDNFTCKISNLISPDKTQISDDSAKPWIMFNGKVVKGSMSKIFNYFI